MEFKKLNQNDVQTQLDDNLSNAVTACQHVVESSDSGTHRRRSLVHKGSEEVILCSYGIQKIKRLLLRIIVILNAI
jgi:hypothetical protein